MSKSFADFITALCSENIAMRAERGVLVADGVIANIVADLPEAVHSVNAEERIIAANARALQLYGYSLAELKGLSIYDLYVDKEETRRGFKRLLELGRLEVFTKIKTKRGELLSIKMKSFALFDSEGNFVKTISMLRDITEQRELKRKLLQASRFSEMGKFAAGIAHDIRSPLTVLKGFTDCVLGSEYCRRDTQVMSAAGAVQRAVEKVERYTTRLLQVRVAGADEAMQAVNLASVMSEALEMLDSKIRACDVTIDCDVPADYVLQGREQQLEQVFSNIISNACDAVKDRDERRVIVRATQADGQLAVSIADTGSGVEEKLRAKIFASFFTTKSERHGTGIGLTIASEIVTAHQGHITVSSNVPQGTVFTVVLPVRTTQARAAHDLSEDIP